MTFSIIARDKKTGKIGIGVCTGHFAIGALVPHIRAKVGAITTQAYLSPILGKLGLDYLEKTNSCEQTLRYLQEIDPEYQKRQLQIMDWKGDAVSFTGNKSSDSANNLSCENLSVAGNILLNDKVIPKMYEKAKLAQNEYKSLDEVIMLALETALAEGGDKRGHESAAMIIYGDENWAELDLRVDSSKTPIKHLRKLLNEWQTDRVQQYWSTCPKKADLDL